MRAAVDDSSDYTRTDLRTSSAGGTNSFGDKKNHPRNPTLDPRRTGEIDDHHFTGFQQRRLPPDIPRRISERKTTDRFKYSFAEAVGSIDDSGGRRHNWAEYLKGELKLFDAPLGVITNSPSYDWHETNLRNYINLSPVALPGKKIQDLDFKPLGGGSGMIGLPGDFTPPSRFVRAVAFSKSARPTQTGEETLYELFRILDNFNVPLGAAKGTGKNAAEGLRSATAWTSGYDTKNKVMYYHTQHNRRVRMIDIKKIDFAVPAKLTRLPLDKEKKQDIEDISPRK
jgi:penicillin V acylase-like amidase (Ntn superfamily)